MMERFIPDILFLFFVLFLAWLDKRRMYRALRREREKQFRDLDKER